jgi:hypothetical protein
MPTKPKAAICQLLFLSLLFQSWIFAQLLFCSLLPVHHKPLKFVEKVTLLFHVPPITSSNYNIEVMLTKPKVARNFNCCFLRLLFQPWILTPSICSPPIHHRFAFLSWWLVGLLPQHNSLLNYSLLQLCPTNHLDTHRCFANLNWCNSKPNLRDHSKTHLHSFNYQRSSKLEIGAASINSTHNPNRKKKKCAPLQDPKL